MATLLSKINTILIKGYVRIPHLRQLVDLLKDTDEDVYTGPAQTDDIAALKDATDDLCDARAVVIADDKTAAKDAINALIETAKEGWPFADEAAFTAMMDALKTDQALAITTNIDATITDLKDDIHDAVDANISDEITVNKSDVLAAIKEDIKTALAAYTVDDVIYYQYPDQQCKSTGEVKANSIEGAIDPDNDTLLICPGCNGLTLRHEAPAGGVIWEEAPELPEKLPE